MEPMKSSIGIALRVSYLAVPRDPSSSETRAMVFSSGASTTLTKSKCPSVAHCALTVAPSCSISRLTSLMREGLFLMVWTPSGVRVESMMYVATPYPPVLVYARAGLYPIPRRLRRIVVPVYGVAWHVDPPGQHPAAVIRAAPCMQWYGPASLSAERITSAAGGRGTTDRV